MHSQDTQELKRTVREYEHALFQINVHSIVKRSTYEKCEINTTMKVH